MILTDNARRYYIFNKQTKRYMESLNRINRIVNYG